MSKDIQPKPRASLMPTIIMGALTVMVAAEASYEVSKQESSNLIAILLILMVVVGGVGTARLFWIARK